MDTRDNALKLETASLEGKDAKLAKVSAWLENLDDKQLNKLIELEPLIKGESDTCERMLAPELVESKDDGERQWRVTFVSQTDTAQTDS